MVQTLLKMNLHPGYKIACSQVSISTLFSLQSIHLWYDSLYCIGAAGADMS